MIWWDWDRVEHGYNKPQWKKLAASHVSHLQQAGFSYDEAQAAFYLPIRVTPEALAQAVNDEEPEVALSGPITDALDRCRAAKLTFDKILTEARRQRAA